MEPFIISARKYRPRTFEEVVGQQAITNTLKNAIARNHLAQALLFCGPRGVGKTTCARILAKMINRNTKAAQSEDDRDYAFNIFELDAASNNSVDDIRNLIDQVRVPPQIGTYKVYIIDEVHMLSQSAFNAFLKTLEEPPKHAIFILATTEKQKIIPTILSRCQIFDFRRITAKDIKDYLKKIAENQGVAAEDEALQLIALKADGALRDALSVFDRMVSFAGNELTRKNVAQNLSILDYDTFLQSTDLILENRIPDLLLQFNALLAQGFDGRHYIAGLATHFRELMLCRNKSTIPLLEVGEETRKKYEAQAAKTSFEFLIEGLEIANSCDLRYRESKNQRLLVELALMQMASWQIAKKKSEPPQIISPSLNRELNKSFKKEVEPKEILYEAEPDAVNTVEEPAITLEESSPAEVGSRIETATPPEASAEKIPEAEKQVENNSEVKENSESSPIKKTELKEETEGLGQRKSATESATTDAEMSVTTLPNLQKLNKTVSGLSLSSLTLKKKHQEKILKSRPETETSPENPIDPEDLLVHWKAYIALLVNKGKKILASNLASDRPKLKDQSIICLKLPNDTMKKEVLLEQGELLAYLKEKLGNHKISLEVEVDSREGEKYAFSAREKYEKLLKKNPLIDELRKEFDLEI